MMRRAARATVGGAVIVLAACLSGMVACSPSEEVSAATAPYTAAFGEFPDLDHGDCYARVAYLPRRKNPSVLSPIPLFLFDHEHQIETLLGRLVRLGHDLPLPSAVVTPFTPGTRVVGVQEGPETTIVLTADGAAFSGARTSPIMGSLAKTVFQFPHIHRLVVIWNDQRAVFTRGDLSLWTESPPGPPELVVVSGSWRPDETLQELMVSFDRPVKIQRLQVQDETGGLEGEYYHSAFKMSAVIHPVRQNGWKEGLRIPIAWSVEDYKGRKAQGEGFYPLRHLQTPVN